MLLRAAEVAGARVWRGFPTHLFRRQPAGWEVVVGGRIFQAAWLVDATGRGSTLARQFGVTREILDQLVSIHIVVPAPIKMDCDTRTWIEACAVGWWYSALVPGGRRVFALQTDADLLPGQEWRSMAWFRQQLEETRHIGRLAGSSGQFPGQAPGLTSAQSSRLGACHGDSWVAVGDAAQSFDPLSGEGLFHALLTGRHATEGLQKILSGGQKNLGDYAALTRSLWDRFLLQREECYARETRWPQMPFWVRRGSSPG
jgi:flavin-dependent dehydrogenase